VTRFFQDGGGGRGAPRSLSMKTPKSRTYTLMLESAESEDPRLISGEIIFEIFTTVLYRVQVAIDN